jgi:hypothetical protein
LLLVILCFENTLLTLLLPNLTPKISGLFALLLKLMPKFPIPLAFSQKFCPQSNLGPAKRPVQDAPVPLRKCAEAAPILAAQSSHVQRPHNL